MVRTDDARFAFGKNWASFQRRLDETRIQVAMRSLKEMLGLPDLQGRTFLDLGSGSGLFSLAARRMGATVHSFDYDPDSVACTAALRDRFFQDDERWVVESGDVLDDAYMEALGTYDVVYSWGVLHHTGDMSRAIRNAAARVAPGGLLYIAIYNRQRFWTPYWRTVKRIYCRSPLPVQGVMVATYAAEQFLRGLAKDTLTWTDPRRRYRRRKQERGMSMVHDWVDWIGGYPYEAATGDEVRAMVEPLGFVQRSGHEPGHGPGCNEFVFQAC